MQPFVDMKIHDNRRFVWECIASGRIKDAKVALVAMALSDRTQPNGNGAITLGWKSQAMVDYLNERVGPLMWDARSSIDYILETLVDDGVIAIFGKDDAWGYFTHGRSKEEIAADQRAMLGAVWGQR